MWTNIEGGDIVVWRDGTLGVLVECKGVYYGTAGGRWSVKFAGPTPSDYDTKHGVGAINLFNGCHTKEILSVKDGYVSKSERRAR